MLVQAVDKLDTMASQRQYRAASSLLEAVRGQCRPSRLQQPLAVVASR
jgi:hypothetical protein